jgi:hypothetical protein
MTDQEEVWTDVEIFVFKPYGYSYGYFVQTNDRGAALEAALIAFEQDMPRALVHLNGVTTALTRMQSPLKRGIKINLDGSRREE